MIKIRKLTCFHLYLRVVWALWCVGIFENFQQMDYLNDSQIFPPLFQDLEIIIQDNSKDEYHERICEDLKG